MKNTIIITTQYKENYGAHDWDGTGSCPQGWKNKGSYIFNIELDADILMYCNDASAVLSKMCESHNTDYEAFEYIDHEIQWNKPTSLGTLEEFLKVNSELNPELA